MEELHVGTCKTVVSMKIGENTELQDFLKRMIKSNPKAMTSLQSAMVTICSEENYVNDRKFKSVSEPGIHEIKVPGIRLYCFQSRLADGQPRLIIATNGGTKNTDREQNRNIKRAAQIKDAFFAAKQADTVILNYIPEDHEN